MTPWVFLHHITYISRDRNLIFNKITLCYCYRVFVLWRCCLSFEVHLTNSVEEVLDLWCRGCCFTLWVMWNFSHYNWSQTLCVMGVCLITTDSENFRRFESWLVIQESRFGEPTTEMWLKIIEINVKPWRNKPININPQENKKNI